MGQGEGWLNISHFSLFAYRRKKPNYQYVAAARES